MFTMKWDFEKDFKQEKIIIFVSQRVLIGKTKSSPQTMADLTGYWKWTAHPLTICKNLIKFKLEHKTKLHTDMFWFVFVPDILVLGMLL